MISTGAPSPKIRRCLAARSALYLAAMKIGLPLAYWTIWLWVSPSMAKPFSAAQSRTAWPLPLNTVISRARTWTCCSTTAGLLACSLPAKARSRIWGCGCVSRKSRWRGRVGWGRLVCRGSRPFEGVDGLQDLDFDGRGLLGERLSVRRHTHHESVMVGHGELGLDLLDHPGRLGGVHHVGVATDADQGNVGLDFFDVRIRITVTREPVAMPV